MAARITNGTARTARGWPRSVRHVRVVGRLTELGFTPSGARHGAAGELARHLPWRDSEFPGVRLGAHDVGGCGGHGERCPSRPASPWEAEQRARRGAALPQPPCRSRGEPAR